MRRIIAYVDAFSFYYGLTKNTRYRWCDIYALCQTLFPRDDIVKVKIFTGRSKSLSTNLGAADRQNAYIRALRAQPRVDVYESRFTPQNRYLPLVSSLRTGEIQKVQVRSYQEKETDVKLAVHLVTDAATVRGYDVAVVFTNDLDFAEPIRVTRKQFGKTVYLIPTCRVGHRSVCMELVKVSTDRYFVSSEMLSKCQLPEHVADSAGNKIHRPLDWA